MQVNFVSILCVVIEEIDEKFARNCVVYCCELFLLYLCIIAIRYVVVIMLCKVSLTFV